MDKNELLYHLQQCEKQHERRKRKRYLRTVLFYTVVLLVLLYWFGQLGDNIAEMLIRAVICFIISFFGFFINIEVFGRLIEQDKEEEAALNFLRKRLKAKEQEENYKE